MPRIGIISEHASPLAPFGGPDVGGQNVYVAQLAKHLAAGGYEVDVLTRRDSPSLPDEVRTPGGFRVIHVPAGPARVLPKEALLTFMTGFSDFIIERAEEYDLLHANYFMSGLVAADVKRARGTPFVVTFHALGRVRLPWVGVDEPALARRIAIEERVVAEADRIVAECPQDRADLLQMYAADPVRVETIPAGFAPEEFPPVPRTEARRATGLVNDDLALLQVGRIVPRKGIDASIRALGRLHRQYGLRPRLLVVGGEARDAATHDLTVTSQLIALAAAEGVADRVEFVGARTRSELNVYYRAADAFVTVPWYEPFGLTVLEAMACGVPVVGSHVGGISYTVRDGVTGVLVPPRDPDTLALRLARLLDEPSLREWMGRNAYRRAYRQFTWGKVAARMVALYEAILRQPRGRAFR